MIRRCGIDDGGVSPGVIFEISKSFVIRESIVRLCLQVMPDGMPINSQQHDCPNVTRTRNTPIDIVRSYSISFLIS